MKLSIEQSEKLEELAKLSGIYKRYSEHLVEELNLWRCNTSGEPSKFRMLFDEMVKAFPKHQIKLVEYGTVKHPYEAVVTIHSMTITALVDNADFRKYYPEKIEEKIIELEMQLAEYRRSKQ